MRPRTQVCNPAVPGDCRLTWKGNLCLKVFGAEGRREFFLGAQPSCLAAGDRPAGMLRDALHPPRLPPSSALPVSAGLVPITLTTPPHLPSPQVDTTLFAEFQAWRESPTLDKNSPFLERVYREDVGPCLDFTMQEVSWGRGQPAGGPSHPAEAPSLPTHLLPGLLQLSALVRAAVEDNTLTIEPVASQTPPTVKVAAVEYGSTK